MSNEPASQQVRSKKTWYKRLTIWLMTAVVAGLAAFVTGGAEKLLNLGAEKLAGGPAITVVSDKIDDCPYRYVVPGLPARTPPPPGIEEEGRDQWARRLGAADGGYTRVEVVVTGESERPVVLQGIDVEVIERKDPMQGFEVHAACGDALPIRYIEIDLDTRPPVIVASEDDRDLDTEAPDVADKPVTFPYRVSRSEAEVFSLYAKTESCNCTWRARLRWVSGDDSGEHVIDNDGKPFHTHGTQGLQTFVSYSGQPLEPE